MAKFAQQNKTQYTQPLWTKCCYQNDAQFIGRLTTLLSPRLFPVSSLLPYLPVFLLAPTCFAHALLVVTYDNLNVSSGASNSDSASIVGGSKELDDSERASPTESCDSEQAFTSEPPLPARRTPGFLPSPF